MASTHGIAKGFPQPPNLPETCKRISAATAQPNIFILVFPYSILLLFECDFKQLVLNTVQKCLPRGFDDVFGDTDCAPLRFAVA